MPHDASVDGWRIDQLLHSTSAFVLVLFLVMLGWILLSVFRDHERQKARFDRGDSPRAIAVVLGVSAALFLVVDGHLFVGSVRAWRDVFGNFAAASSRPGAVRIEVNAHQWVWTARYAGPDGRFNTPDDIVTLSEIVVPQGAPVIFQLVSTDVIHGFSVPNLRVKMDAVPGMVTQVWLEAKETGEFEIACAQHCGTNHYKMKGKLIVLPRGDWEQWAAAASANSATAYDENDREGHWGWDWAAHANLQ
jgi:cytochrome c oxidase subunit 2